MLTFRDITPQDRSAYNAFVLNRDTLGCHENFTTLYIWAKIYQQKWCLHEGWILLDSPGSFAFPVGEGDLRIPIMAMLEHRRMEGRPFSMWGMDDRQKAVLEEFFPGKFVFEETREYFDYLYDAHKLAELPGKKLHAKRNFINRFESEHKSWSFEVLTHENLREVKAMNLQWERMNDLEHDEALQEEIGAIHRAFRHYEELDLTCGLIRADGRVVAFSMGSPLGTRAFNMHIEKAYYDVPGAYPLINREMARHVLKLYPHVELINREDDTGNEGLRKAKLSYYPEILLRKWLATWTGN